jgi:hypothetical protein
MAGSPIVTLRLPPPLKHWFDQYIKSTGLRPTDVLRDFLEAARDHRLVVLDAPMQSVINDGSVPECPVSICLNPR